MKYFLTLSLTFCLCTGQIAAQSYAAFTAPDTTCVNTNINITNTSVGGTTFYWGFNEAPINTAPQVTDLGNPGGLLNGSCFSDVVQDQGNYYVFVTNNNPGRLIRLNFGNSLSNTPTALDLGNFNGVFPNYAGEIKVVNVNGNWWAIVVGGNPYQNTPSKMVMVNLGGVINGVPPNITDWGNIGGLNEPFYLNVFSDGTNWYGIAANLGDGSITQLNFGNNFFNAPTGRNIPNIIGLNNLFTGLYTLSSNGSWNTFVVTNQIGNNNAPLLRLDFGSSFQNNPVVSSVALDSLADPAGLYITSYCGDMVGFTINRANGTMYKLDFNNNIAATPVVEPLGSFGNYYGVSFSKFCREDNDIYCFVPLSDHNTINRLVFAGNNVSVPPSSSTSTSSFSIAYTTPGTYTISLLMDDGLPTVSSVCKTIVVTPCNTVNQTGFSLPDTVCVNAKVNITNTTTAGQTFSWGYCMANLQQPPASINLYAGNNMLHNPMFADIAKDSGNYYAFVTDQNAGTVIRLSFGNSLLNAPVASLAENISGTAPAGIKLVHVNNHWYAIVVESGESTVVPFKLIKIDFGSSLANNPISVTDWGDMGGLLQYPNDLAVFYDGAHWHAFLTNFANTVITQLDFGVDFSAAPIATSFTIPGNLFALDRIFPITQNGNWYLFAINSANNALMRLDFGNSLQNQPVYNNLGNPGNAFNFPTGIALIKVCGNIQGLVMNNYSTNDVVALNFNGDISSSPTGQSLGAVNNISEASGLSAIFRDGSDYYAYVPALDPGENVLLHFAGCQGLGASGSTDSIPPVFSFPSPGVYTVNLTVDAGLPDETSICKQIVVQGGASADFTFSQNVCSPSTVTYAGYISDSTDKYHWDFGNNQTNSSSLNNTVLYSGFGTYPVNFIVGGNGCTDTITKLVAVTVSPADIITTEDTSICTGSTLQLNSIAGVCYCWSPSPSLTNAAVANPFVTVSSTTTFYLNELVTGANLVINGDFSQGNTSFTSAYQFASPNTVEEQYFVGPSPQAWNAGMSACTDHTGSAGNGNMLMLNGAPQNNVSVWGETIKVQPNTNYAFAVWVATLTAQNPAQLQFSINGKLAGNILTAPGNSCNWQQFYVTWNPGSDTSAVINVINQNTIAAGNDFALDDISFSAVSIQQDSVKITALPPPLVKVSGDSAVCTGLGFTLTASGASNYNWYAPGTVPGTVNNNPLTATPSGDTTLVVRGYNIPGCYGYETVSVSLLPLPAITITPNKSVCVGDSVTLVAEAAEAKSYQWSPTASLNGYSTASPIAHPASSTTYVVTVTGYNGCSATDSVLVAVAPLPHFSVSPLKATVCYGDTVYVAASGGDVYQWQPAAFVSNPLAASTVLYPKTSATYSVIITSNACNLSDTLTLAVSVNPLPVATVSKSNDIDCTVSSANLSASGGLTYLWYPAGSLNIATGDMVVASPGETTTYSVIATDGNGCSDTATIAVKVVTAGAKNDYPMASAFTPNGDGINDCFGITFWGAVSKLNFTIFDRWGVIVFHTNSPSDCWDGTYKGQPQPPGAFVYQIQANTICGPVYRKGTVVLLR